MIYYLLDLLINNLGLYTSSLILIKLDNLKKYDMFYILLIDIFINKIPIVFVILLFLRLFNIFLRKKLTKSFFVDNVIYIFNYLIFMLLIFIYKNDNFIFLNLINFYLNNFLINYIMFCFFK